MRSQTDWDDPQTTIASRNLIQKKPLLKQFYVQCYDFFKQELNQHLNGKILELGSGAGFIKEHMPNSITSDVLDLPFIDARIDAMNLPFQDAALSGICMIDVFHHIPDVAQFLKEAERVLVRGGKIVMVEPANTNWGRFIYQNFHHEPFLPNEKGWKLPEGGPMSSANGALPWMVFKRDWYERTSQLVPSLKIKNIEVCYPLLYLLSGGLSWPQLVPSSLGLFMDRIMPGGMFYRIVVEKQ